MSIVDTSASLELVVNALAVIGAVGAAVFSVEVTKKVWFYFRWTVGEPYDSDNPYHNGKRGNWGETD